MKVGHPYRGGRVITTHIRYVETSDIKLQVCRLINYDVGMRLLEEHVVGIYHHTIKMQRNKSNFSCFMQRNKSNFSCFMQRSKSNFSCFIPL